MISLIALLTAVCGFLNELNFAQSLSAVTGGTALRYQTTFGLFTFFLGVGAWLFDRAWIARYSTKKILVGSQIGMVALSGLGPLWITFFNPLTAQNPIAMIVLCYFPIAATGLVSGLELPALLLYSKNDKQTALSPLAWDYVGMFLASVLFPLYLVYTLGIHGTSLVLVALSLVSLGLIARFLPTLPLSHENAPARLGSFLNAHDVPLLFMIFILSFCSFCYELLLAKILGDILHDETLAYSAGIGIMMVGLGVGTFRAQKKNNPLHAIIHVELQLVLWSSFLFFIFYGLATFAYAIPALKTITDHKWLALCFFSPLPFFIGWLTGFELPLLLRAISSKNQNSLGLPIALNYLGALFAGILLPLFFLPRFTVALSLQLISCLNFSVLCYLMISNKSFPPVRKLFIATACVACFVFVPRGNKTIEQFFLKTYYYQLNLTELSLESLQHFSKMQASINSVERETTQYQFIDKVKNSDSPSYFQRAGFLLFLNKQQQLDSENWKTYHHSFVHGALNLHKKPISRVLICGGGDGILARALLEVPTIQKITLVELDPRMLELAREDLDLLKVNASALLDKRVEAIVDDAYAYAFNNTELYDAIFIDFPYPDTFELSRLFSVEYYSALKNRLAPNGFIVLDAPIWRYVDQPKKRLPYELKILKDTLAAAGFLSQVAFGTLEPFIFATVEKQNLQFDYESLPAELENTVFSNLASLDFLESDFLSGPLRVNSIFKPQRFFYNE